MGGRFSLSRRGHGMCYPAADAEFDFLKEKWMGDDREWQKQLANAALTAAVRTGLQFLTNPGSRDETVNDVKSKLAEVDYTAAAKAVSDAIDRLAENSKAALSEAIDNIRANAEEAVEAAAEKAQEQLGTTKKRGRGRLLFGILLGIGLGFILLNEDRRNQIMDKLTGASGPIDSSQWDTVSTSAQNVTNQATAAVQNVAAEATTAVKDTATQAQESAQSVADTTKKSASDTANTAKKGASDTASTAKSETQKVQSSGADTTPSSGAGTTKPTA